MLYKKYEKKFKIKKKFSSQVLALYRISLFNRVARLVYFLSFFERKASRTCGLSFELATYGWALRRNACFLCRIVPRTRYKLLVSLLHLGLDKIRQVMGSKKKKMRV